MKSSIMREEIFHSTLGWQTRERLTDAARLRADRELYEVDRAGRLAILREMRAEAALSEQDTPAIRAAAAETDALYEASKALLFKLADANPI
jgi:hypothetical protein